MMVFLNGERPSLTQRSNREWYSTRAVGVLNANIRETEEDVRVSIGCLHLRAKYQVQLERTEVLSAGKYSQHGSPILHITNFHVYLCFSTSPTILLSSLLLVDGDAVPSSLLLCVWRRSPG